MRERRCFPGDPRVWWAAAAVSLILAGSAAVELLRPRDVYTGTFWVATRSPAVTVPDGVRLCLNGLEVPPGTGAVHLDFMGPAALPRVEGELWEGGRVQRATAPAGPAGKRSLFLEFPRTTGGSGAGIGCSFSTATFPRTPWRSRGWRSRSGRSTPFRPKALAG